MTPEQQNALHQILIYSVMIEFFLLMWTNNYNSIFLIYIIFLNVYGSANPLRSYSPDGLQSILRLNHWMSLIDWGRPLSPQFYWLISDGGYLRTYSVPIFFAKGSFAGLFICEDQCLWCGVIRASDRYLWGNKWVVGTIGGMQCWHPLLPLLI